MPEIQRMEYTDDTGETYELFIETDSIELGDIDEDERQGKGATREPIQMQQATRLIRGYATYALSAFKNFGAAKVEEVTLTFGLKIGGKVGIPYITEGSSESNLSIQVKCKFPE
jgi:hypothetical protein